MMKTKVWIKLTGTIYFQIPRIITRTTIRRYTMQWTIWVGTLAPMRSRAADHHWRRLGQTRWHRPTRRQRAVVRVWKPKYSSIATWISGKQNLNSKSAQNERSTRRRVHVWTRTKSMAILNCVKYSYLCN